MYYDSSTVSELLHELLGSQHRDMKWERMDVQQSSITVWESRIIVLYSVNGAGRARRAVVITLWNSYHVGQEGDVLESSKQKIVLSSKSSR